MGAVLYLCLSAAGSTCLAGQSFRFVVVAPTPVEVFSASEAGFQASVDLVSENSDPLTREGATGWSFSLVVRGAEVSSLFEKHLHFLTPSRPTRTTKIRKA